ncbi:MAG: hypothetical protein J7M13_04655 [Synergistetes bacterium]|nr:hypothetical protein [Synergistota bacterium]
MKVKGIAFIAVISLVILFSLPVFGADEKAFIGDLIKVEKLVYGKPQQGAVIERLNRIERMLFGRTLPGTILERQRRLIEFVFEGTEDEYPLCFKIASLEWLVLQEVFPGPLSSRVDKLEEMIIGKEQTDKPLAWRVENLIKLCVPSGEIKMGEVELPKEQLVKVTLLTPLDSRKNKPGDLVRIKVISDLIYHGVLVIPRGSIGYGKVVKVERAGSFGKAGKVNVEFNHVEDMLGEEIPVCMGKRAAEENKREMKGRAWAVVSSFVGLGVFGPVGLVAGAFVHGEEAKIPAGAKFYLETSQDVKVKGLIVKEEEVKKEIEKKGEGTKEEKEPKQ